MTNAQASLSRSLEGDYSNVIIHPAIFTGDGANGQSPSHTSTDYVPPKWEHLGATSDRRLEPANGIETKVQRVNPAAYEDAMPNPGDELTDAKIALAEARTDTKLRDVDLKFERVLGEVRLGFQELRTDMASFKGEVGTQLAAMPTRAEARSNMQWTIGTLAALIVAVAGLIVASFQTGLAVGVLPPKSPQLEAAPVVVPAPGAAVPVTPKANPAP